MARWNYVLLFSAVVLIGAEEKKAKYCCGTNTEGKAFLAQNKERKGVITLESGLQYKVIKKGTGKWHPKPGTPCRMSYAGTTPRLTPDALTLDPDKWDEYDSTSAGVGASANAAWLQGPREFIPGHQVTLGQTEAMKLMVEGDIWEVYIPSELGFGDDEKQFCFGCRIVNGGEALILRMEMISIQGDYRHKVPASYCDFKSRENCVDFELALLETWGKKSLSEVKAEINRRKDDTNPMTVAQREKALRELKALKSIKKLMSGKEEL